MTKAKQRLPTPTKQAENDLERLKTLIEESRAAGQRGDVVTLEAAFAHLEE